MVGGQPIPWQPSTEVQSTFLNRLPPPAETTPSAPRTSRDYTQHQNMSIPQQVQCHKDEVELMSSDSSSSSSSDE